MMKRYPPLLLAGLMATAAQAQSGALDPTYGNGGIAILQPGDFHDVAHDAIALEDNTSLICGVARFNGRNSIFIAHLLEDGALDTGFGTNGGYTFFTIGQEAYGYAMARDADGRIYVTGTAYPTLEQSVVPVVRTDANGQPDGAFGLDGVLTFVLSGSEAEARDIVILDDNRIVLGGSLLDEQFDRDAFFMRLLPDGSPDTQFGGTGIVINTQHEAEDLLNCIAVLPSGNVAGAGYANVDFAMKTMLFMVGPNGNDVGGFGTEGMLLPGIGTGNHAAWGMVTGGNALFVTGYVGTGSGSDIYVACIREDGLLFPDFSGDGILTLDLNPNDIGLDIARYTNGDLIVCGTTGENGFGVPRDFFVARCTSAGDLVQSFGTTGATVTSIQQDFDDANAVAIQPDGKLLLAGFTSGFSSFTDNDVAVARYDVDWTLGTVAAPAIELGAFPNPADGGLLTITHDAGRFAQVLLRDATGRVARDFGTVPAGASQLSLTGLAGGRYILELRAVDRFAQHAVLIAR